jgi:hypothetical protein
VPILNYRTVVDAERTVAELQRKLVAAGARSIMVDYDADGEPTALSFRVVGRIGDEAYRLPANVDGVFRTLTRHADRGEVGRRFVTRKHARRVAWRILKDWTEAQIAIIQAGMVTLDEVLLPWMIAPSGQTVAELYASRRLALPAPGESGSTA